MRKKIDQVYEQITQLEESNDQYDFPELLLMMRNIFGLTRRAVCKELGFSEMRMFWLEHGCFRNPVTHEEIDVLAKYYGVSSGMLKKKHDDYIKNSKPQPNYKRK